MPSTVLGRRHRKHKRSRKRLLSAIAGPAVLVGRQDNTLAVRTWARVSAVKVLWADDGRWGLCTAQGRWHLTHGKHAAASTAASPTSPGEWKLPAYVYHPHSPELDIGPWPCSALTVDSQVSRWGLNLLKGTGWPLRVSAACCKLRVFALHWPWSVQGQGMALRLLQCRNRSHCCLSASPPPLSGYSRFSEGKAQNLV